MKRLDRSDAIARYVRSNSTVGVGGQNLLRNPVGLACEIALQKPTGLRVVGCNLSLAADLIVGAGCVSRIECGSLNLELYGVPPFSRHAIERGTVQITDWDHLSLISKLKAAQYGLPFMPIHALLGTDLSTTTEASGEVAFVIHPWNQGGERVAVVRALKLDVCIVHVQCADLDGNLYASGAISSDVDLMMAANTVIVSCEEVLDAEVAVRRYGPALISGLFVDAVVLLPSGARPTGVPGFYEPDGEFIKRYCDTASADALCARGLISDIDMSFGRGGLTS